MKILSVLKNAGLCVAIGFAGQANASLVGTFSGALSSFSGMGNTVNGDLAADIAADNNAPFSLGTLFTGSFMLNEATIDSDPSPSVGLYRNSLLSFSIAGGDINETVSKGWAEVEDNEIAGSMFRDSFNFGSGKFDESFVINGNNWVFDAAAILLKMTDTNPPSIFNSDALQQQISESTPWSSEQLALKFTRQGLANSTHYALIDFGQPNNNLAVGLLSSPTPSATVPTPATLPLLIAALGLLGIRRRS